MPSRIFGTWLTVVTTRLSSCFVCSEITGRKTKMSERILKHELVDFLRNNHVINIPEYTNEEAAELIINWMAEEYDRQLTAALGDFEL